MTPCTLCPNPARPSPGALYCAECQERQLAKITQHNATPRARAMRANEDRAWQQAGLPPRPWPVAATGWRDGTPNVTCPACQGRYHYGAPGPFTHLCPLCETWVCWRATDETKERKRRVAKKCPVCDKLLLEKSGPYGPWWGCTWVRKDHKDNCPGRRRWHDCEIVVEQVPKIGLAVWEPYAWSEMDKRAEDMAVLAERIEGFELWLTSTKRRNF